MIEEIFINFPKMLQQTYFPSNVVQIYIISPHFQQLFEDESLFFQPFLESNFEPWI